MINYSLSSIVLAAGLSRRMGKDNKLLLPWGDASIIEKIVTNILDARVGETLVVVGYEAELVYEQLSNAESQISNVKRQTEDPLSIKAKNGQFFTILRNNHYEKGMTTSIQKGVEAANANSLGYMICLSDMPFIEPQDYRFLAESFFKIYDNDKAAIVQPTYKGARGNPTIFSHLYKKDLQNLTYTEGGKPIVQAHPHHVYLVEMPSDSVLKDIDSQIDYERYIREKKFV